MLTFTLAYTCICLIALFQQVQTDFNDLGKLMLGGVAAALVFALAFTFVRLRLREKNPQTSNFISINASTNAKDEAS